MGKLFFYSDQVLESPQNRRLDDVLFEDKNPREINIVYIPSTEDKEKQYFHLKKQYYQMYGVENVMFFDLYSEFDPSNIVELVSCDMIHLSAGDPIAFRKALKERNIDKVIKDYYTNGGTIVGVSGGAVQLSKSTRLFHLFIGSNQDSDIAALQLVDFEFLPHYNRWDNEFKAKVKDYVQSTGTIVYAGNDGDGIIVENGEIRLIGDIAKITKTGGS